MKNTPSTLDYLVAIDTDTDVRCNPFPELANIKSIALFFFHDVGTSPSAVERNKAIASKSYIVDKPSAALLDSLNESQKSAMESTVMSSVNSRSELSQGGDKSNMSASPESPSRPGTVIFSYV